MTDDTLELISRQITGTVATGTTPQSRNFDSPPLHLWNPELSGDIDITIKRDGQWVHEGTIIERQSLVRLFASILRREDDGEYYLVTPAEKWRLKVDALPLLVTDFEIAESAGGQELTVTLNTDRRYLIDAAHPLYLPRLEGMEDIPAVQIDHGLGAVFSRAAWYRLVNACEENDSGIGISSCGTYFKLG
ncbi:DUF1285 domain-containing protein [Halieaceae bacterium IMCC14734]|uniref:DUF1285 domain-containing protein n=1 Tax=Candidatus Litorirhabdus singularis TaxID=2518993 RepID=A0ABT3TIW7_9GAMM|nr:DUF1285 domain-containing protein [Candidatus Litorirhabdus singularis]